MKYYSQIILFLLFGQPVFAQEQIFLKHSCSYDGEENAVEYYQWNPSSEADRIVEEICTAVSLQKNFVVKSSNVRNAVATMDQGKRLILYSTLFLEKFKSDTRTQWAAYSVLAHEIGHHLNYHNFDEKDAKRRKLMELEADQFSGGVLRLLGATLDESKAGIETFALEVETGTHPLGSARREAIASGWKKQDERMRKLNPGTSTQSSRTVLDSDGDGIPDTNDECPNEYGSTTTKGCPDADEDGVPDGIDVCKYQKGESRWQGCPDTDGDGLPDHQDDCPRIPGIVSLKGCPALDRDSDGIPDQGDICPDIAGLARFQGCPDTDGDNIPDPDDKCPKIKGDFAFGGCPEKGVTNMDATYTDPFAGTMIFIKGGTFEMGTKAVKSLSPVHVVALGDFYIGETEVTQIQWRSVMGSDPPKLNQLNCDKCPVEGVSWAEAQQFIKKLNVKVQDKYRLPTEAEWEFAARGGTLSKGYKFAGSNNVDEVAWVSGSIQPVKGKKPNELGVYDMSGNVWEWCQDWLSPYSGESQTNPQGPALGNYRICRGGSVSDSVQFPQVMFRDSHVPGFRDKNGGFRLAKSVATKP